MASTLKTPGVYIEEIVKFPPSVAQVETAIPAFIGYTEKATNKINGDLNMVPTRITSLLEYERFFGFSKAETSIEVTITDDVANNRSIVVTQPTSKQPFLMYYSLQLYFANGGGPCYITSVGRYGSDLPDGETAISTIGDTDALKDGLDEIGKVDEPTLIVFPDATRVNGIDATTFYGLYNDALTQCNKLQDRFTIIDTLGYDGSTSVDPNIGALRDGINLGKDFVKYGAAYYPYLETILNYSVDTSSIDISHFSKADANAKTAIKEEMENLEPDVAIKSADVVGLASGFPGTFTGKLADVISYLYEDNVGVNEGFDMSGTKNYASPRPENLRDSMDDLLGAMGSLVELKNKIKKEADAALSALADEAVDTTDLSTHRQAFLDDFEDGGKIEEKYNELVTLQADLKKHITSGDTAKIKKTIDTAATSIHKTVKTIAVLADYKAPANTDSTLLDTVVSKFATLKTELDTVIEADTNNGELHGRSLSDLETKDNDTYNKIRTAINNLPMELPPSSGIAGVYARVDSTRGVWKAPANVGLTYVVKPTVRITNDIQDGLNVDTTSGKSVNAIRSFTGKGVMVWGARTLAGNDNEWRYVSVRRFFNMVEESVKKASDQFVFEPNDANTWVRIKAMITNFLTNQWKAGALAGATTDDAFYVKVGLNQTMTADDILNGIMNIEIGMAVVRPAEFIVLKFSHKMQES
ncbi:phage tail sheath C-terminal domain-containing protein [Kordia jejudonensis]|uniref:phage tail sheath C-terminal domain-containing protein n=1 Tax=Kordia jejudonensis TaxID=1348245 RepID=UPI000629546F|nr:phage tail sheath C-terminal domain-containing protein [Kordia jejudonensis]